LFGITHPLRGTSFHANQLNEKFDRTFKPRLNPHPSFTLSQIKNAVAMQDAARFIKLKKKKRNSIVSGKFRNQRS
jgi:hypothetical protein